MTRKLLFAVILLIVSINVVYSQSATCPALVTTNYTVTCAQPCAILTVAATSNLYATDTYTIASIPYAPFSLSAGTDPLDAGTPLELSDDDWGDSVAITFPFCFYGNSYTYLLPGSNGNICFTTSLYDSYDPWPVPGPLPIIGSGSEDGVQNCVMFPWNDVYADDGTGSGTFRFTTYGVEPCRVFVYSYDSTSLFDAGTCPGMYSTEQVVLYESSNIIDINIGLRESCADWNSGLATTGICNSSESSFYCPAGENGTTFTATNQSWRISPAGTAGLWTFTWYDSTRTTVVGTGASFTVCPTTLGNNKYYVSGSSSACSALTIWDSVIVTYTSGLGASTAAKIDTAVGFDPTTCGVCNGYIILKGVPPGFSDTLTYRFNGVTVGPIVSTAASDSTITYTGLCAGTYSYFSIDVQGCTDTFKGPIILSAPPGQFTGFDSTNPSVCGACDGTITLVGLFPGTSDTITYDYNGVPQPPVIVTETSSNTAVLTGLCAGTYANFRVLISDCLDTNNGPVTLVNPIFQITGLANTNTTCGECNGTITLTGMTPLQTVSIGYSLNGVVQPTLAVTTDAAGMAVLTNLCPGTYSNITATLNTCVAGPEGPVVITSPPVIPITVVTTTNPTGCGMCNGTITISGLPVSIIDTVHYTFKDSVYTYLYAAGLDSLVTIYGLCGGNYDSLWMSVGACPTDTINQVILTPPVITPGFTDVIHYGCKADSVFFNNSSVSIPTGVLYYDWAFGDSTSDTVSNPVHIYTALGTYTVIQTVTNNLCTLYDTVTFTLANSLSAGFTVSPDTICQLSSVTFTNTSASGLGSLSYFWNFGDGNTGTLANVTHIYSLSGSYPVTMVATNVIIEPTTFVTCSDTATALIQVDTQSNINLNVTDTSICQGTYMTFAGTYASLGNIGIVWNFGDGDTIKDVNPVIYAYNASGVFTVVSTALYRVCENVSASAVIRVFAQPAIYLGADTAICPGSSPIVLTDYNNAVDAGASWTWNTGNTGPSITVTTPGLYWATVNINNCLATDSVHVLNGCYIEYPNIFTPNGDGINDYFFPRQLLTQGLVTFNMNIYNRWGQLIFTTCNIDGRGWDGKFNDIDQPEGVYVYIIDASFIDGQTSHHQGNITLLR